MDIGHEIKYRRLKLGWTQQHLADRLGVVRSYIADLEKGRKSPSIETLAPVVAALGGELRIEWNGALHPDGDTRPG